MVFVQKKISKYYLCEIEDINYGFLENLKLLIENGVDLNKIILNDI